MGGKCGLNLYEFKGKFAEIEIVEGEKVIEKKTYLWFESVGKYIDVQDIDANINWLVNFYKKGIEKVEILSGLDTPIEGGAGKIYMIRNKKNGKKYVGLTVVDVLKRFQQHSRADSYIGNVIRKHGKEAFELSVIDTADTYLELAQKERKWIEYHKSFGEGGYNLSIGGELGFMKRN